MKYLFNILALIGIITAFSSCNNTDDVHRIFTNGKKKMTMLLISTSSNPREQNFWGDDAKAKRTSMELKDIEGHYEIIFDGNPEGDEARGIFTGRGVNSTFEGNWWADGHTNKVSMLINKTNGHETDILAIEFIKALKAGVYKYQGNDESLSLFYKDGGYESKKFIGFVTLDRNQ